MTRLQKFSHAAGFTLMEIMTTLAIIGMVSGLAAASLGTELPRYRLNGAVKQMVWHLKALRLRAISHKHTITVTFANDHVYTIWTDSNDNGGVDDGEIQQKDIQADYKEVQFASTNNPTFHPKGTVSNAAAITLTSARGSKVLNMNIVGDVRVN